MSTNTEIKQQVLEKLKLLPVCKPDSSAKQWTIRCPYCGDSIKHHNHGHFSILFDMDGDMPMLFRCFRCNESGIISSDVLEDIGIHVNPTLADDLKRSYRRVLNTDYFNNKPATYKVPEFTNRDLNIEKLYYINQRLETDLSMQDAIDYRIILSISEFMTENHLKQIPDISDYIIGNLEKYYVGFLSSNRNRIVFRRIKDDPNLPRYYKMIINPFNLSKNTFYALPGAFDLLYTEPINIHIAEGTFDIISIKHNLPHDEPGRHLYYAACGFNYNSILRWLLGKGVNTDIHLNIYSDKDKKDAEHQRYLTTMKTKIWIDSVKIHRNQYPGEKDFGVPCGKIEDGYIKLR